MLSLFFKVEREEIETVKAIDSKPIKIYLNYARFKSLMIFGNWICDLFLTLWH